MQAELLRSPEQHLPAAQVESLRERDTNELRVRVSGLVGASAVRSVVEVGEQNDGRQIGSLFEAIQLAAEGDPAARKNVITNFITDMFERTYKTGMVISVPLWQSIKGLVQYGQTLESVYVNTLRRNMSPQMRQRSEVEARNFARIEKLNQQGLFEKGYSVLVVSMVPDDMSKSEASKEQFFVDNMSCSMQLTGCDETTQLRVESAFVSGAAGPDAQRFDMDAVIGLYMYFGVDVRGKTVTEILDTPLMIHNSLLPNGVLDVVKLYDQFVGGKFFGQDRPQEDYIAFRAKCIKKQNDLKQLAEGGSDELIRASARIHSPEEACRMLSKISARKMIDQSIADKDIDPRVFGVVSAANIHLARDLLAQGEYERMMAKRDQAIISDNSSSCPGGVRPADGFSGDNKTSAKDSDNGPCEFISKECPKCKEKNVKTVVTARKITGSCGCSVNKK